MEKDKTLNQLAGEYRDIAMSEIVKFDHIEFAGNSAYGIKCKAAALDVIHRSIKAGLEIAWYDREITPQIPYSE